DDLPVLVDIGQHRRRRHVVIPDAVMDELEVPLALTGLQIDAHQALTEQVVPWPVSTVEIRGWRLHRQVHQPCLLVYRDLGPDAGVAVNGPRLVLPRVVAKLTGTRNRVEGPEQLAAAHVEGADESLGVVVSMDGHPLL